MSRDLRRPGALAGLLGAGLFLITFTVEGWLRPGYDARAMYVSELALGPRGWVQITNFVVTGALLVLLSRGLAVEFRTGKASRAGPILLALLGLGLIASGPFVMDPAGTPRDQASLHGLLHGLFGALVFSLAPASCFVFARRFRGDPAWRPLWRMTHVVGSVAVAAIVLMKAGQSSPPNALSPLLGLLQRCVLVPYFAWLFAVAWTLRRRALEAP